MLLPSVSELLGRVGRHPAVEATLDALRRGERQARLAGLTDPAKALVAAQTALALRRPVLLLVESNQRAEALTEPLRFFFRALGGRAVSQVATLPAHDVLPWQGLSPHPEILETRAVTLWRFASGQTELVVAPVAAAAMRLREADFYRGLARSLERDHQVSLEELLEHLFSVGYERVEMVEMPGQFAVRGGIVDVFSPESVRPVRIELFGDTVESLREFDPGTQRSTGPLVRAALLPLTEFPRRRELLERAYVRAAAGASEPLQEPSEEELRHAGIFPGWESEAARLEPATSSLFELCDRPVVVFDEPEALEQAREKFHARVAEAFARAGEGSGGAPPDWHYLTAGEWQRALEPLGCLLLERLPLRREGEEPRVLPTQPTTRYHGNVSAFMAEVCGRLAAG